MQKSIVVFNFQMEENIMRDYNTSESSLTEMALWAQGMIVGSIIAFASTALLGCLGILVT